MSNSSGTVTAPLFIETATDVARRLERDPSPAAQQMRAEALALVTVFRAWQLERPEPALKVATIQRLFDLQRRAMDLLVSADGRV